MITCVPRLLSGPPSPPTCAAPPSCPRAGPRAPHTLPPVGPQHSSPFSALAAPAPAPSVFPAPKVCPGPRSLRRRPVDLISSAVGVSARTVCVPQPTFTPELRPHMPPVRQAGGRSGGPQDRGLSGSAGSAATACCRLNILELSSSPCSTSPFPSFPSPYGEVTAPPPAWLLGFQTACNFSFLIFAFSSQTVANPLASD